MEEKRTLNYGEAIKEQREKLTEIIYPDEIKRYAVGKVPVKQPDNITKGAYRLSSFFLSFIRAGYKIDKINMDGLKPPYILLCNHNAFFDFMVATHAIFPHRANYVVAIDGFFGFPLKKWLLRNVGGICKRKFTTDLVLIRQIKRVLDNGDVLILYPEARYSPCGTTSYMPESLGKIIKIIYITKKEKPI